MTVETTQIKPPLDWLISDAPVDYAEAVSWMEARAAAIRAGTAQEAVWLLAHPPLYTAGTSANPADLRDPRFPVFESGRGGQYTYHGPRPRVPYVILGLKRRFAAPDLRAFVCLLEDWLIATLAQFGIRGERRQGRVGIWVDLAPYGRPGQEAKIAAIGIRVRRWVSFHGVALNIDPDLSHFAGIVPCGIAEHGVTSMADLGHYPSMAEVDMALRAAFAETFGAWRSGVDG